MTANVPTSRTLHGMGHSDLGRDTPATLPARGRGQQYGGRMIVLACTFVVIVRAVLHRRLVRQQVGMTMRVHLSAMTVLMKVILPRTGGANGGYAGRRIRHDRPGQQAADDQRCHLLPHDHAA